MKDSTKVLIGVGVAGGLLALVLWPKKAAAGQGAPLTGGQVDFAPGVTRNDKLQVGGSITVALPPSHGYHVGDFVGVDTIVGTDDGRQNASTGYIYFTMRALSPGRVTVIVDTKGETDPMTFNIEVVS